MLIKQEIENLLRQILKELAISFQEITVDYPADRKFGDYSTNVALVAAKQTGKKPRELAEEISERVKGNSAQFIEKVEVAGPGFINFWIQDAYLFRKISDGEEGKKTREDKKILVEFAHPNTHKAFHLGHLRNITTGEAIVRLLKASGAEVIRANYQGDVGMHIAKTIYGLALLIEKDEVDGKGLRIKEASNVIERVLHVVKALEARDIKERMDLIGKAYAYGSKLFEENGDDTASIRQINTAIYSHEWGAYTSYEEVYFITRKWSLDYLEEIYKRVGTHFDRYYFESEVYEAGKKIVLAGLKKGIFVESDGAIIFPGEKYGLHNRVFITSEGNPTYEGKDMGLAPLQQKEYHPDQIMHVLGPEQYGYTRVIFKVLDLLFPEDAGKQLHLVYGWVKLKQGKMSSRTGNVILGEWLLDQAKERILQLYKIPDEVAEQVAVGAVKYSFLKVGLNQDIAFDMEESISLDGNSGPYLQYTYARTQSVLRKAEMSNVKYQIANVKLEAEERDVLRLLARFPEIVTEAAIKYAPNTLSSYLFELAQAFNLFYQKYPILKADDQTKQMRLALTVAVGKTLKQGLQLLGIHAPDKM